MLKQFDLESCDARSSEVEFHEDTHYSTISYFIIGD